MYDTLRSHFYNKKLWNTFLLLPYYLSLYYDLSHSIYLSRWFFWFLCQLSCFHCSCYLGNGVVVFNEKKHVVYLIIKFQTQTLPKNLKYKFFFEFLANSTRPMFQNTVRNMMFHATLWYINHYIPKHYKEERHLSSCFFTDI